MRKESRVQRSAFGGLRPFLISSILLLTLAACGFEPLHGARYQQSLQVNLAAVDIVTDRSRFGQLLKAEILDQANPDNRPAPKQYRMNISFVERELAFFINPDGTSTSGDLQYSSSYTLTRLRDGAVIDQGSLTRVSSYNTSQNADYASFVSKEDSRRRVVLELAQDYKLRLANLLPKLNDAEAKALDPVATPLAPELSLPSLEKYETQRTR